MSYNNSYEKPPMTQTGEAAAYGQTGTGGSYGQSGVGTGYGDTAAGTGTGTYGAGDTGAGGYPETAHTGGKEGYSSSYNATAHGGGDTGGSGGGYGQYSDPSSQPPPNYMAAQTQKVRGWATRTKDVNAGPTTTATPSMALVSIVILTAGATAVKSNIRKKSFSSATKHPYYIGE